MGIKCFKTGLNIPFEFQHRVTETDPSKLYKQEVTLTVPGYVHPLPRVPTFQESLSCMNTECSTPFNVYMTKDTPKNKLATVKLIIENIMVTS